MHPLGSTTITGLRCQRQALHLWPRLFLAALLAFGAVGVGCGSDSDCVVDGTCDDDEEDDATDALSLSLRSLETSRQAALSRVEQSG